MSEPTNAFVERTLSEFKIKAKSIELRTFPGENWVIALVPEDSILAARVMAAEVEARLNDEAPLVDGSWVVVFRPIADGNTARQGERESKGRLFRTDVDKLIQLVEARSRTSIALPSLNYVEDPRASLSTLSASRHQIIFGRRGVGKTSLLIEAQRRAAAEGHAVSWTNAQPIRDHSPERAFLAILSDILEATVKHFGSSQVANPTHELLARTTHLRGGHSPSPEDVANLVPDVNRALRSLLSGETVRLFCYIDDFYLYPAAQQPALLDRLASSLRDCDAWLKIASIERLTRPWEPSTRLGLEVPHDATTLDIDLTLENPSETQGFLEKMLSGYTKHVGLRTLRSIAKKEALGRLILASGGVPRDYLNLFSSSITVARSKRPEAAEIGKEDVAIAAGEAAASKKRDLSEDVNQDQAGSLLAFLNNISTLVKDAHHTYFLIKVSEKGSLGHEWLQRLVDLRFIHLVQASLSDQHRPGVRYEAYMLDLSEFAEVRLSRGLNILDIDGGDWTWRLTGSKHEAVRLSRTGLRDRLRVAPVIDLGDAPHLTLDA